MPKAILDRFTRRSISRQRRYQLRHIAKGLCVQCSQKATVNGLCLKHAIVRRERGRQRAGSVTRHLNSASYLAQAQHDHKR